MAIAGEDFLESANRSLDEGDEVGFRNAISRSYYAMYHKVLSTITSEIPRYSGGGVHSSLLSYLEHSAIGEPYDSREMKKFSYMLKASRDLRCLADYEIGRDDISRVMAEDALLRAKKLIERCTELKDAA
jgi:uncharacterized protein (UPF0332 family)